ncbi:MAG: hypothetical protein WD029_10045 [Microthrixaceae bacterium]
MPSPDIAVPESSTKPSKPKRRRLSIVRVMVALLILVAVVLGGVAVAKSAVERGAKGISGAWFAPYVDATLVPTFPFEDPVASGSKDVVLGFIVGEREGGCIPTWGTYVDLDGAATSFDLDRRIARLTAAGGTAIVSFGGASNTELALQCDSSAEAAKAYGAVIDRYKLNTVDIDIEGEALRNTAATTRRGQALKQLQDSARAKGGDLVVWLTLPVAPFGLTDEGLNVVNETLATGLDLGGVNVMTMDYGAGRTPDISMAAANRDALLATYRQLDGAYRSTGKTLRPEQLWAKIGATPMIGQNDTPEDIFTLDDADDLLSFAKVKGMGRLSMWSSNRDSPCGKQMDVLLVSNTCSGVEQKPLGFTQRLNQLPGRSDLPASSADSLQDQQAAPGEVAQTRLVDNAETSPYPIWQVDRVYRGEEKVVWHGNVYEAKWYSDGDLPDAVVKHLWDSPWRLLGPVLETDLPAPKLDLPTGTFPEWSKTAGYAKGKRVLFKGRAFEAKWYSRGDTPNPDRPWESPWQPVTVLPAGSGGAAGGGQPLVPILGLPEWSGDVIYNKGDRVQFQEEPYEAKNWNRETMPGGSTEAGASTTWVALNGAPVIQKTG